MILQRLKDYIDYKHISTSAFEKSIGMSNASFGKSLKNNGTIGADKLENILSVYTDINPEWLLTGRGSMLKDREGGNINIGDYNKVVSGNGNVLNESPAHYETKRKKTGNNDFSNIEIENDNLRVGYKLLKNQITMKDQEIKLKDREIELLNKTILDKEQIISEKQQFIDFLLTKK